MVLRLKRPRAPHRILWLRALVIPEAKVQRQGTLHLQTSNQSISTCPDRIVARILLVLRPLPR
jgi:hypothetical protein